MLILHQSAVFSSTVLPAYPLLAAPPKRPALPAPKIAGYLPVPKIHAAGGDAEQPLRRNHKHNRAASEVGPVRPEKQVKRVVEAEIVNPLMLIDIRTDFDAWWEEFDRMYPSQTIEELDAEIEAKYPGWIKLTESWS